MAALREATLRRDHTVKPVSETATLLVGEADQCAGGVGAQYRRPAQQIRRRLEPIHLAKLRIEVQNCLATRLPICGKGWSLRRIRVYGQPCCGAHDCPGRITDHKTVIACVRKRDACE